MDPRIVLLSGGFDPVHVGHVRMIQEAAEFGQVWIGINSDEWLIRKKGYNVMSWQERKEILQSIKGVFTVDLIEDDKDDSSCWYIKEVHQSWFKAPRNLRAEIFFGNGGDRIEDNVPEVQLCKELGIEMLWGLGGGKVQSSSSLIKNFPRHKDIRGVPDDLYLFFGKLYEKLTRLHGGKSILQIGARPGGGWLKMFQLFKKRGYEKFDVLEIWRPNLIRLEWDCLGEKFCGDARHFEDVIGDRRYDLIIYWHGLEHIPKEDGEELIPRLKARANRAVFLGMPFGRWDKDQDKLTHGNPHEEHLSAWYPSDLEKHGYDVYTLGKVDNKDPMFGIKLL